MNFNQILTTLPSIEHLHGLNICEEQQIIHFIPAITGKLGSLKIYYALSIEFNGKLDRTSSQKGLKLFAEHVTDAKLHPGKHPNIDLLLKVVEENLVYQLIPLVK
ncbi:DUF2322 family protein [Rodentibacter caecimuris]|uniref:DUF2322 domain-containing protein n=1 Tax=Rodentibacter caecimuris TaxID=1796644 RepID=A0ABX3KZS4_9PAST|nr:hypothetical protein BKG89_00770 [Rodentibacter heylii]